MVAVTRIEQVSQEPESCIIAFILNGSVERMTGFKPANLLHGKQTLYQLSYIREWSGRPESNRHTPTPEAGEINHSSTSRYGWQYGIRTHVWNFFPGATIRCLNLSANCHVGTTRIERVPSELQSDAQITTTYATCP